MKNRFGRNWLIAALLLTVLALGVVVAGRLTAQAVQARAAQAPNTLTTFACTVMDVGVFIQRVHVRCTNAQTVGGNTISWWAYPSSDSANASRFLSVFETAKATGSTVTLYYDGTDLSGSTFGCGNSDCRRIWGATTP